MRYNLNTTTVRRPQVARAIHVSEIMNEIENLDVKEEIKLLDLIAQSVNRKVNEKGSDNLYWLSASEKSLKDVWDNEQDEVYNELFKR